MKGKQLTLFPLAFNSIEETHRYYSKTILYCLYPDNTLNIQQIYAQFSNKHQRLVRAAIKDLETCLLIYRVDNNKGPYCEKKYNLTRDGKELISSESIFNN
ncbi:hypothetical protein G9F72_004870 [Clostridium estertheticum]|uniref:hypothetical protein n=1 Tax=Clostridium estertheticum TaxID=238834 RepID=UPI0013E970B2|nr:hypothetical protein [Clostridium estertheticum]MBZ9685684.1 hypothetical protein [Clostridium estertheticum]